MIGDVPMSNGQTLAQMYPTLKTLYDFLWLIGEAIFFYLPVGICWASKRQASGTSACLALRRLGYQAQVIPALLAGLTLEFIENAPEAHRAGLSLPGCRPGLFVDTGRLSRPHRYRPVWSYDRRRVAFAVRYMMTGSFAR
ncbi:PTS system, trehalose-specific IIBC component [Salmonella enterica subsp. arizonae]|uniref:PTS system, trehalose-specific IIBC component n=1 Tax=Salmonella enterica subsp. arizonae TaxID=59203 RepID=A0A2X4WU87_SALER|nr:PTS system, trehalose-specific IIBC component [Salmonella enterica subsp. arizonae]